MYNMLKVEYMCFNYICILNEHRVYVFLIIYVYLTYVEYMCIICLKLSVCVLIIFVYLTFVEYMCC